MRSWIDHQFATPPHYEVTYTRAALIAAVTFSLIAVLVFVGIYTLEESLDLDATARTPSGELLVPRLREMQIYLGVLVAALTVAASVFSTVLARMGERQRSLSRRESLTGCFNRRAFYELFPREVERARRLGQGVAVVFLDIDHFKRINDRYGHETGDHVLQLLSARLRGIIRETDLLFRWGGEEFVILMPHTGPGEGPALAERIRAAVEERPFAADRVSLRGGRHREPGCRGDRRLAGRPRRPPRPRRRRLLPGQGGRAQPCGVRDPRRLASPSPMRAPPAFRRDP